jgi:formylglycine-generating enzyme required for sulfatase activity
MELDCDGYRLPTEAEWEFAARAGTITPTWFESQVPEVLVGDAGWYRGNANDVMHGVRLKADNPWGLFDVYGNAAEWVHDWRVNYGDLPNIVEDPLGREPAAGEPRVRGARGGSIAVGEEMLRSAYRGGREPTSSPNVGFRVVLGLPADSAQ